MFKCQRRTVKNHSFDVILANIRIADRHLSCQLSYYLPETSPRIWSETRRDKTIRETRVVRKTDERSTDGGPISLPHIYQLPHSARFYKPTYEKPQYCNFSRPNARTILNISRATNAVVTYGDVLLVLSFAMPLSVV